MDKDNVHIDNEFTDHSWNEMSKLLDREMPVKKRKKRLIWIWFLGIGLLALIGLTTYFQQDTPSILKSLPIPVIKNKVASNAENKKVTHQSAKSSKSTKKVSKSPVTTKSSDNISVISTIKNPTKNSPTAANVSTAVGVGVSPSIKNDLATNNASITSNNLTTNKSVLSPSFQKKEITDFFSINSLTPSLLSIKSQETIIPVLPVKNRLKWRFGVYASVLSPKLGSFRSGLHANLIFNPKWRFHFGMGYAKRISSTTSTTNNNQEFASPIADMEEMEDMSTTAGTGAGPVPSSTNPNPNEIDLIDNQGIRFSNFHYFELPFMVQYRIQSKFSVELGGSLSYLHGYRYQYQAASFFSNNANLAGSFDTSRSGDLLVANAPTVSSINWALIGGVNYQLTTNLAAYANYHYSTPYLKSTTSAIPDKKRWQQMELGIRYYFK